MSKKTSDKYENDFNEYEETSDFSMYDEELEESVRESRRARREAKKRRRVKAASKAKKQKAEAVDDAVTEDIAFTEKTENNNIKIKSTRKKRLKNGKKVKVASAQANESGARPKKKKKGCLHKLLTLILLILCSYGAYLGGVMLWTYFNPEVVESFPTNDILLPTNVLKPANVPDRTIALLMVTDEDKTRTDSMVLANYDNVNKKLTLVSIPRDIMVEVTDEDYIIMRSEYPEPGNRVMKMNHIHHFGGEAHGVELLLNEIKVHFGVEPDYYVKVDFDGFNAIVDSIGGVEFDVPQDMDYEDPTQDLAIHLKKGKQVLNGSQAQQLVRFRKDNYGGGYVNGDIDRLKVQQAFMREFMAKALRSDVIFKNVFDYLSAFNKYVTTNATIKDMANYASVLKSLNMDNVTMYTLPCTPSEYGEYELNEEEAERLIYNVFKKPLDEVKKDLELEEAEKDLEKSNDKKIQVLNGGYTDGMAREIMARFNEKEINVEAVGTYNEGKPEKSIIYTSREGIGLDLVKFFYNGADVVVDPQKTGEYDIVVVVGVNEPLKKGEQPVTSEFENEAPQVIEDTEAGEDEDYSDSSDDNDTDYDSDDDDDDDDDYDYDYDSDDDDDYDYDYNSDDDE